MTADLYQNFLERRSQLGSMAGFKPLWMPSFLFDFQGFLTDWNLRSGRSATFSECGTGKTIMELVWSQNVVQHTNRHVLILTPLAVAQQTVKEAARFSIDATRSAGVLPPSAGTIVTNYEKLHLFSPHDFSGVVCDESSCLKNFDGARKAQITEFMKKIPYRLLATATPAPNDYTELGTSSEALGELGHIDMLNRFFVNDQNTSDTRLSRKHESGRKSNGWRFKGHAEESFYRYICSWARAGRKPSDFGPFSDEGFDLPPLIEKEHIIETRTLAPGMLFPMAATNMREERAERRRTIEERCEYAAELVAKTEGPSVVWCHLNDEANLLVDMIRGSRQISSATSDDEREEIYSAFSEGQLNDLVIKPKIGAWGLNWQHCRHMVSFASHSYEQYHQAVRRFWRFGQTQPVTVDLIATEGERGAKENLQRKSAAADRMFAALVDHMNNALRIDRLPGYDKVLEVPSWL